MAATDEDCVLAIDLGTSGPKVALFTVQGAPVACEFEPNPTKLLPGGGAEQDPEDWWTAIRTAARRLADARPVPPEKIVAVCCTSQWSGTVPVGRDGRHLRDAIIWLDSRGAEPIARLVGGPIRVQGYGVGKIWKWLKLTGGMPGRSGKDPIAHILWLRENEPDVDRATHKYLEPKDYLNLRLTGRFAASFDSIALHWVTDNRDIRRVDYHPGLLRMATLDREKLPDLRRAVDVLGPILPEVADDLGVSREAQVVMGTPDLHSAAIGSGAVRDFEGHLYIGTSSWLVCHVPFKKVDVLHNMTSLPSAIPERYFVINEQESAGACMNFLRDNVFFADDELGTAKPEGVYKRFDRLAETAPAGSNGTLFAPWLYGERTPVEDHTIRGGFHNVSLRTTRADMIRAAMEGVAFNSRWLLDAVEGYIKRPFGHLNVIGGGANSAIWCRIQADVLNREIRQVKDPIQANARGAGILGAVGMGRMSFDDVPERVEIAATYRPNPDNRAIYEEMFREFKEIYRKNKAIHARLNRAR